MGHEWTMDGLFCPRSNTIYRTNGEGCPFCKSWHPKPFASEVDSEARGIKGDSK